MRHYLLHFIALAFLSFSSSSQAQAIVGCNTDVYDAANEKVKALMQHENEATQLINRPVSAAQLTCLDQYSEVLKATSQIQSNKNSANTTIASLVQQPLKDASQQFLNGNLAGSIQNVMNTEFAKITATFQNALSGINNITGGLNNALNSVSGALGGGGGANVQAPSINCDMQNTAWLSSQCLSMPQLTSLTGIITGKMDELSGAITNAPQRLIEKACNSMQGKLNNYMANVNGAINNVANKATTPLSEATDSITQITN